LSIQIKTPPTMSRLRRHPENHLAMAQRTALN
jgi:hypothetical protein